MRNLVLDKCRLQLKQFYFEYFDKRNAYQVLIPTGKTDLIIFRNVFANIEDLQSLINKFC